MQKYSTQSALLHWLSLLLVTILFVSGLVSHEFEAEAKNPDILQSHIFLGIFLLVVSLARLWFRFSTKQPEELETINNSHKIIKKSIQFLLYIFSILTPLAGLNIILSSDVDLEIIETHPELLFSETTHLAREYHEIIAFAFLFLILAHSVGIVLHILRTKTNILGRMWPDT
jgi:cytochrome b561